MPTPHMTHGQIVNALLAETARRPARPAETGAAMELARAHYNARQEAHHEKYTINT